MNKLTKCNSHYSYLHFVPEDCITWTAPQLFWKAFSYTAIIEKAHGLNYTANWTNV